MPLSDSFAREPADFYGLPVAVIQNSFQRTSFKMGPTTRTIRPASGSCCRGQAEPAPFAIERPAGQSCHGLFVSFSRACRMLFHSTRVSRLLFIRANAKRRQSPQPCLSLAAIRSWVLRRLIQRGAKRALCFQSQSSYECDIPAVAGPSACSGDLRLANPSDVEAVTTDQGDVLPFRISFPSEVSAPSDGAL